MPKSSLVLATLAIACCFWNCNAQTAAPPNPLPEAKRDLLVNLREIFSPIFEEEYPVLYNFGQGQFAVMTFDNAGFEESNTFSPCPDHTSFTHAEPVNYVARVYQEFSLEARPAIDIIFADYFQDMIQRYFSVNGVIPQSVNLFTYNAPCQDDCALLIALLAEALPDIDFYIGYEQVSPSQESSFQQVASLLGGLDNVFFGSVRGGAEQIQELFSEPTRLRRRELAARGSQKKAAVTPRGRHVKSVTHNVQNKRLAVSTPSRHLVSRCWFESGTEEAYVLTLFAANSYLKAGPPPEYANDNWDARAQVLGQGSDWNSCKFLFFDPNGVLHAVKDDRFYKGSLPVPGQDWFDTATLIGSGGWNAFKFLFFHPDGTLYGALTNGHFYKAPPPVAHDDSFLGRATHIGLADWNNFQFLFFDPISHDLYGARYGQFFKAPPPTYATDNWLARSTQIGTAGWQYFHQLFFDPTGLLYGVDHQGRLLVASPPEYALDNWVGRTEIKGTAGWDSFKFVFFSPLYDHAGFP